MLLFYKINEEEPISRLDKIESVDESFFLQLNEFDLEPVSALDNITEKSIMSGVLKMFTESVY